MVFSSLTFLYCFLPITVILYFICKKRLYRNIILLIASLIFYSWGEPVYILLMLAVWVVAYIGGLRMDFYEQHQQQRQKKTVFIITVVLVVLNLVIFKYLNFLVHNVSMLFSVHFAWKNLALPIGISFYTFQILTYVIDLYNRKIKVQKSPFYLLLYISFFPKLIVGPIVRYQTIEMELVDRTESWDDAIYGTKRFIVGLAKKVLLADNVAKIATAIYSASSSSYGTAAYWLAAVAYTLQIYFDFSGYSDMAIGLGRIFGFHFLENFNYPYISKSVTEFWRRWHISLSTWFRDYIYIPLGGNRVKKSRWILNILIVWALTGLWHGANWNFILWGIYYAILLLIEKLFLGRFLQKTPAFVQWLCTFFLVTVGWVIFNLTNFSQMFHALSMMFTFHPTDWIQVFASNSSCINNILYLPIALVCMFPILKKLKEPKRVPAVILCDAVYLGLMAFCVVSILSTSFSPFIYFRF